MTADPLPPDWKTRLDHAPWPLQPVTRLAPSPTGPLHLGHVAHLVFLLGIAQWQHARVHLRMEDHDRQRCKPEHTDGILNDLHTLGVLHSGGMPQPNANPEPPVFQHHRQEGFETALKQLQLAGHRLYGCRCSRKDAALLAKNDPSSTPTPDPCRDVNLGLEPQLAWKVVLPPTRVQWHDALADKPEHSAALGETALTVRDRLGNWTYTFAVVVDDLLQGVNLVVRGGDLQNATPVQLQLRAALSAQPPPLFIHHPLLYDDRGQKLGKRYQSEPINDFFRKGETPEMLWAKAAHLLGLWPDLKPLKSNQLGRLFAARP